MTDLNELLERVREAKGPDRELDHALWLHFDETAQAKYDAGRIPLPWTWCLTSSIDAALALTERMLPGWMVVNLCEWEADVLRARGPWQCILKKLGTQDDMRAPKGRGDHAPTAPLAILQALLTALKEVR